MFQVLKDFEYRPSRWFEADHVLETEQINCRLYGPAPVVGERYTGKKEDGEGWMTSTVVKVMPLMWAVGFIGGEHIAAFWLIRTRSGTLYAVAELC